MVRDKQKLEQDNHQLDQDKQQLVRDKQKLEQDRKLLSADIEALREEMIGKVKILKADVESERSRLQAHEEEFEMKLMLYQQELEGQKSKYVAAVEAQSQSLELESATLLEHKHALEQANAKIRRLAQENARILHSMAAVQESTTFKVGSLITLPFRAIKVGKSAINNTVVALPEQSEIDRKAAPVKPLVVERPGRRAATKTDSASVHPRVKRYESGPLTDVEKATQAKLIAKRVEEIRPFYELNGFAVVRNLLPEREVQSMAEQFKSDLVKGAGSNSTHTTLDVAAVYPPAEDYVFDPRVLAAVRGCLGDDVKFLQWATYQLNHMSPPWHRDGAYRTYNVGKDWDESEHPYRVAKIILYFECEDFAMGLYPGSHRKDVDRGAIQRRLMDFDFVDSSNQKEGVELGEKPHLARVKPGDALIFDQRLFHCGRIADRDAGAFSTELNGDKSFLSLLYGADNPHSSRFYSYFNHERQFGVRPMHKRLVERLKAENLLLSTGQANYFETHSEQRSGLWLPEKHSKKVEVEGVS